MPTYEYVCNDCGGFDAVRTISARNDPCSCPVCESVSTRVWASAPGLSFVSSQTRTAHSLNERARHEPKRSADEGNYARMKHPSGCGCCSSSNKRGATVQAQNGSKAFPSKRPWMISH